MNDRDWSEYFTKARDKAVADFKAARSLKFRLIEKTANGERDITDEHFRRLQDSIDEYQRVLDSL
jgi:hypothetical protein